MGLYKSINLICSSRAWLLRQERNKWKLIRCRSIFHFCKQIDDVIHQWKNSKHFTLTESRNPYFGILIARAGFVSPQRHTPCDRWSGENPNHYYNWDIKIVESTRIECAYWIFNRTRPDKCTYAHSVRLPVALSLRQVPIAVLQSGTSRKSFIESVSKTWKNWKYPILRRSDRVPATLYAHFKANVLQ